MTAITVYVLLFIGSLFFAAFFAYLETACTTLRLFEINQLELRVQRFKRLFALWRSAPQQLLIAVLIACNLADVLCSVCITRVMEETIGGELGLAIGVVVATAFILLFGNIIPKSFARMGGRNLSTSVLGVLAGLTFVLAPVVRLCAWVAQQFSYRLGGGEYESDAVTEKELEFLIDYSDQKGLLSADKSELLQNIFDLGQTSVAAIMVPRSEMVLLEVNASAADVQALFSSHRYSRIPLYEGSRERIVGFVYQKDLFALLHTGPVGSLREVMRPVLFVARGKKVSELLREFLRARRHLAIVLDAYGVVEGLVTLEDVLEEIVGEIRDEHEIVEPHLVSLEDGSYVVDGKVALVDVAAELKIEFPRGAAKTIGAFVVESLGRVPRKGDSIAHAGYFFIIEMTHARHVRQIRIRLSSE